MARAPAANGSIAQGNSGASGATILSGERMAGNQMHVQTLSVILMTLAVILITLGSMLVRGETPGGIQVGGVLAYEPRFSTIHREFGPESWLAAPGIGAADQDGLSPPDCCLLQTCIPHGSSTTCRVLSKLTGFWIGFRWEAQKY